MKIGRRESWYVSIFLLKICVFLDQQPLVYRQWLLELEVFSLLLQLKCSTIYPGLLR